MLQVILHLHSKLLWHLFYLFITNIYDKKHKNRSMPLKRDYVKGFVINKAVNHISEISLIYPETKC